MPARRPPRRHPSRNAGTGSSLWRASENSERTDALLLDTHAWVWTLDGHLGTMSVESAALVLAAAADGRLYVSDISYWEVSLKAAEGKLQLSLDPTLWLSQAATAPGIQNLALSREVLIQSTRLVGEPHGDPADRMLIASAQLHGLSLLTCDETIVDYAAVQPGIPVCDARR